MPEITKRPGEAELLAAILHHRNGRWLELEGITRALGFGDQALAGELDRAPGAGPVSLRGLADGRPWRAGIAITARPAEPGTRRQRPA